MTPLERAVWQTILYADVFEYPLTLVEVHHYLLTKATLESVTTVLQNSTWLNAQLATAQSFYFLKDRQSLIELRKQRKTHAEKLWGAARQWLPPMGALPFVRMIAITGALAMDNVTAKDDIDLLIVTEPKRVWLTRALIVGLVYLARWRGVELCPNYILSASALTQTQRDLYTAHDLVQMIPLVGFEMYNALRDANAWTNELLPQAQTPLKQEKDLHPQGGWARIQKLSEWLLSGALGDWLEDWERTRKQQKFLPKVAQPSAAQLDEEHVKGHFVDHGAHILRAYHERLSSL